MNRMIAGASLLWLVVLVFWILSLMWLVVISGYMCHSHDRSTFFSHDMLVNRKKKKFELGER